MLYPSHIRGGCSEYTYWFVALVTACYRNKLMIAKMLDLMSAYNFAVLCLDVDRRMTIMMMMMVMMRGE